MFGGRRHGILHPEPAVIGIDAPSPADAPCGVGLCAPVFDPGLVEQDVAAVCPAAPDDVLALDIKEVDAVRHASSGQPLGPRKFVVPQPFGLQIGILHPEHVEFAEHWVAEALAHHRLQRSVACGPQRDARLRNPLRAGAGVVVDTHPGVDGEASQRLPEIGVSGDFVLRLVHDRLLAAVCREPVPRPAPEALPVDARRQAAAAPQSGALIPRDAQHPVLRVETVVARLLACAVAVIDPVTAPVVEELQRARSPVVRVFQ